MLWGANRAAAEINQAGGIAGKPVKVTGIDTGMEPQKGVVEMSRIVADALVAMGPVPEPVIMAAMPIAVENGMMSFTATTSYEYAVQFFPWTVSWFPPTEERLATVVSAWARLHPEMKSVVNFVEPYVTMVGRLSGVQVSFSSRAALSPKISLRWAEPAPICRM